MIDVSGTPGEGRLFTGERARYSPTPYSSIVSKPKIDFDSLTFVSREPCFRCGVRADVGCKHQGVV